MPKNRPCITLLYGELKYQELSYYKGTPSRQRHTCITTMKSYREYVRTLKITFLIPEVKDLTYRGKNGNYVSSSCMQTLGIIWPILQKCSKDWMILDCVQTSWELKLKSWGEGRNHRVLFQKEGKLQNQKNIPVSKSQPEVMLMNVQDGRQAMHFEFNQFT